MKNYRFIRTLLYDLVSLALIPSCGGSGNYGGRTSPLNSAIGSASVRERMSVLRVINITPSNPLGISSGTRVQFTATTSYSDNYVQDVTATVVWTSSDSSIAIISNKPESIGMATAVSKGYCSISATYEGISVPTVIGVN